MATSGNQCIIKNAYSGRKFVLRFSAFVSIIAAFVPEKKKTMPMVCDFCRAFDHNADGIISKEELREAMTRYGHTFTVEECDEMFQEAGQDARHSILIDRRGERRGIPGHWGLGVGRWRLEVGR